MYALMSVNQNVADPQEIILYSYDPMIMRGEEHHEMEGDDEEEREHGGDETVYGIYDIS